MNSERNQRKSYKPSNGECHTKDTLQNKAPVTLWETMWNKLENIAQLTWIGRIKSGVKK